MLHSQIWTSGKLEHSDKDGHGEGTEGVSVLGVFLFWFFILKKIYLIGYLIPGVHSGQDGDRKEGEDTAKVGLSADESDSSD